MESFAAALWTALALEFYAHVLYPVLISLCARTPGKRSTCDVRSPVTLIIPAHNEAPVLRNKLVNALATEYPPDRLEILVASDGSTDRTVEIAREFAERGVRVLAFTERRGKASVVNDAVAAARGEVLCLCDANVMFRPDALRRLVARLDDPQVGAVSGDVRLASHQSNFGAGESWYYRLERAVHRGESRIGSMMGVDGGMYVVRRELFQPLPADTILDDFVTSMRVIRQGKRVVYADDAIAEENGTPLARQEFRRRVRVSAGAMQSLKRGEWPPLSRPVELWQYVSHKLLRWAGPLLLITLLVSNAALWREGRLYQVLLVLQVGFYLLAGLAAVSVWFRGTRLGGVPFYFTMSHVAMAVGLVKGLCRPQRGIWQRTERNVSAASGSTLDLQASGQSR